MNDPSAADPTQHSVPPDFPGNATPRDMLMPALRTDAESFPVLKAFQDYIEAERERARRRLATVSAIAIAAIVLVVAAFLAVGSAVIGNLMRRNDQLLESVMRFAERPAAPGAAAPAARADAGEAELERMRALVQRLQQDQTAMQGSVAALQTLPATLATTMGQTLSNLVARSAAPAAPRALPPAPATPFAPSNVLAADPRSTTPAPVVPAAAAVVPPAVIATAPSAVVRSNTDAPTTVSVPTRIQAAARIEGYVPARMTLFTDRGVAIPWRIAVPE